MLRIRWFLCLIGLLLIVGSALSVQAAPEITKLRNIFVEPGDVFVILGNDLKGTGTSLTVHLNRLEITQTVAFNNPLVLLWGDGKIKVKVPGYDCSFWSGASIAAPGTARDGQAYVNRIVWVTVNGEDSNKQILSKWIKIKLFEPAQCDEGCPCDLVGNDGDCTEADWAFFQEEWERFWYNDLAFGTVSHGSNGPPPTMTDENAAWETDEWAGNYLQVEGESLRTIVSNTSDTLTVDGSAWSGGIADKRYQIKITDLVTGAVSSATGRTIPSLPATVKDDTATWETNEWVGKYLWIQGQTRRTIMSNTSNGLTLDGGIWESALPPGLTYRIQKTEAEVQGPYGCDIDDDDSCTTDDQREYWTADSLPQCNQ